MRMSGKCRNNVNKHNNNSEHRLTSRRTDGVKKPSLSALFQGVQVERNFSGHAKMRKNISVDSSLNMIIHRENLPPVYMHEHVGSLD